MTYNTGISARYTGAIVVKTLWEETTIYKNCIKGPLYKMEPISDTDKVAKTRE